jgi:tetratricopeptide (TPR) repeat protein
MDPVSEAAFERLDALLEASPEEHVALLLRRAEARPADAAKLWERAGALRLAAGDAAGAAAALEESLTRQGSAEAERALAQARLAAGLLDPADLEARLGRLTVPQVCAVSLHLGRACLERGEHGAALSHFELAARRSPSPHEALGRSSRRPARPGRRSRGSRRASGCSRSTLAAPTRRGST